jgi:hypothetical protein
LQLSPRNSQPCPRGGGRARRRRCGAGPWQHVARGCDWPHHGSNGGDGGVGASSGEGARRRPAEAPTAARGKVARRRGAGQLASALATLGAREASRAAGRRRTRAEGASTERRRQWRGGARGGAPRGRKAAFIGGLGGPW